MTDSIKPSMMFSEREIIGVAYALQEKLEELRTGAIDHMDLGDWLEDNGLDVVDALLSRARAAGIPVQGGGKR